MKREYTMTDKAKEAKQKLIKHFSNNTNQSIWDNYENLKLAQGSKIATIRQYKPAVIAIESMFNIGLSQITVSQLDEFIGSDVIKNTSHIRGFLITCVNEGLLTLSKDVVAYLIPVEYKKLVEMLMK